MSLTKIKDSKKKNILNSYKIETCSTSVLKNTLSKRKEVIVKIKNKRKLSPSMNTKKKIIRNCSQLLKIETLLVNFKLSFLIKYH